MKNNDKLSHSIVIRDCKILHEDTDSCVHVEGISDLASFSPLASYYVWRCNLSTYHESDVVSQSYKKRPLWNIPFWLWMIDHPCCTSVAPPTLNILNQIFVHSHKRIPWLAFGICQPMGWLSAVSHTRCDWVPPVQGWPYGRVVKPTAISLLPQSRSSKLANHAWALNWQKRDDNQTPTSILPHSWM